MEFHELPEFTRDLRRLKKKYRSLEEDISAFKEVLEKLPHGNDGKHWNCLHEYEQVKVYKVRLACAYLRKSTMRIIYAYRDAEIRIDFIELYYKGEKDNEDRARIKVYLESLESR